MALKKLPGGVIVETTAGARLNEEAGVNLEAIHRQIIAGAPTPEAARAEADRAEAAARDAAASAGEREREVVFVERLRCPVVARGELPAGTEGRPGPFIVEEMDCTIAVPPGWRARRDGRGFILMTRSA